MDISVPTRKNSDGIIAIWFRESKPQGLSIHQIKGAGLHPVEMAEEAIKYLQEALDGNQDNNR